MLRRHGDQGALLRVLRSEWGTGLARAAVGKGVSGRRNSRFPSSAHSHLVLVVWATNTGSLGLLSSSIPGVPSVAYPVKQESVVSLHCSKPSRGSFLPPGQQMVLSDDQAYPSPLSPLLAASGPLPWLGAPSACNIELVNRGRLWGNQ